MNLALISEIPQAYLSHFLPSLVATVMYVAKLNSIIAISWNNLEPLNNQMSAANLDLQFYQLLNFPV